jgi:hypothetical protein
MPRILTLIERLRGYNARGGIVTEQHPIFVLKHSDRPQPHTQTSF